MDLIFNKVLISKGENRKPALEYLGSAGLDVPDLPKECLHLRD